jgi:integrase
MRDAEIQALTWGDVHGAIKVERQLEKIGVAPPIEYETEMKGRKDRDGILKTPRAVVSPPKKKSKRLIPMHPLLQAVLAWWKAKGWPAYVGRSPTDSDPVFPSPAGAYCFPDSSVGVRADLERLGQDSAELTFHALRRTGSTLLEEAGVSRDFVGILLGHGAKSTAGKHYLAQGEALREAVARMALPPWEAVRPALEESRLRNNVAANRSASLSSANGKRSNDQKQETQSGTA